MFECRHSLFVYNPLRNLMRWAIIGVVFCFSKIPTRSGARLIISVLVSRTIPGTTSSQPTLNKMQYVRSTNTVGGRKPFSIREIVPLDFKESKNAMSLRTNPAFMRYVRMYESSKYGICICINDYLVTTNTLTIYAFGQGS